MQQVLRPRFRARARHTILAGQYLLLNNGAVAMPEITETAEIGMNTDSLWREIGPFEAVGDWHPMLDRLDFSADGNRVTRVARGKDGSEQVERLIEFDPA